MLMGLDHPDAYWPSGLVPQSQLASNCTANGSSNGEAKTA